MFKKILIANRGEMALRLVRAAKGMGIDTVAIYSTADKNALHVKLANQAICVGGANPKDSYLNIENIISAAVLTQSDAIHPGYGFLAQNAQFARLVEQNGLVFIGPNQETINMLSNPVNAKDIMAQHGLPIVPGTDIIKSKKDGLYKIEKIGGFPVLLKPCISGFGGIQRAHDQSSFISALKSFEDTSVYLEKIIENPKHIEFSVIADNQKNYIHLYERDCSIQNNYKKIIAEAPCRTLKEEVRQKMIKDVINAARSIDYINTCNFEFILDQDQNYYFIKLNTQIQPEHTITEMITGIDIAKEQIRIAAGQPLNVKQEDVKPVGYSIECSINALNPNNGFLRSSGKIENLIVPSGFGVRMDTELYNGLNVEKFYDPMVGKIIVHGKSRLECIRKMRAALEELTIEGIDTDANLHYNIFHNIKYVEGNFDTSFFANFLEEQ